MVQTEAMPCQVVPPRCTAEEEGIVAEDGRIVEYDLLAGCLEALSKNEVLNTHLCDSNPEMARCRSVLLAAIFIVQAVAFGTGKVSLPITQGAVRASALLNLAD